MKKNDYQYLSDISSFQNTEGYNILVKFDI